MLILKPRKGLNHFTGSRDFTRTPSKRVQRHPSEAYLWEAMSIRGPSTERPYKKPDHANQRKPQCALKDQPLDNSTAPTGTMRAGGWFAQ